MKHLFVSALMLGWTLVGSAQLLNVASIEKVNTPVAVDQAVISPDGNTVVASTLYDTSLMKVSLADGKFDRLVANGSGFDIAFTDDSQSIVYVSESSNDKHLRFKEVRSINLNTRADRQILKPTRHLNGVAASGNSALVVNNRKFTAANVDGAKAVKAPVASIYYGQLMVTVNGKTKAINPQGKDGMSYLWPSVSPDGTKVVYYLGAVGCFVCDIDGTNAKYLGKIRAPRWYDNNIIVGMDDKDNGEVYTASTIVASDLQGNKQVLTDGKQIAMFPTVNANGSKIAFSTPNGELYLINVTR